MWELDPETKAYADQLNQRRAELASQATQHVRKQHVISQVVLRRFTWDRPPGGVELARLDVNRLERRLRLLGPRACGKVDDFIRYASKDAEQMWSRIENAFPDALAAADDGSILGKPHLLEVIKDMLALHAVRSKESPEIHSHSWEVISGAMHEVLRRHPGDLRRHMEKTTGLYLTGEDWVDTSIHRLGAETRAKYEDGFLFRVQQERAYARVRDFLNRRHLQFLTTTEEFLIGDVPAVPIIFGEPRVGLSSGVGIDSADSLVMPLGRHIYVVTDPDNSAIGEIPESKVRYLNCVQIAVAKEEVYFHPESGLEEFVRGEAARE